MVNLVAMPVSRERMERYSGRHLRQIEHASKQWDARESKVKNNNMRRQWLERQNNASFRNEYDRIQGELSRSKIQFGNISKLKQRQTELHQLFSSGNDI